MPDIVLPDCARRGPELLPDEHDRGPDLAPAEHAVDLTFFRLSTIVVLFLLVVLVGGAAVAGTLLGRWLRTRPEPVHQPVGAVQAALLGLVGLVLAFGLTMAVGRYDTRRAILV